MTRWGWTLRAEWCNGFGLALCVGWERSGLRGGFVILGPLAITLERERA